MMKTLLLSFVLLFTVALNAQQYVFVEPFDSQEALPTGWTNIDADGDTFIWYPDYYDGGAILETYAVSASWDDIPLTPDNYLVTPQIDLTNVVGPVILEYNIGIGDEDWPAEKYQINISTTTNTVAGFTNPVFEEILTAPAYYWKKTQVDISAYVGQQVYIAFRHYDCTDNYKILLDSVNVSIASYVGLGENDAKRIQISPNPCTNDLSINGTGISRIIIRNIVGQEVADVKMNETIKLDVSDLKQGAYFVSIYRDETLLETRKVLKR
ncbi:MAG: choice-of-anchor J domain-containing protein [Ignavibacteria bacterium]|nr:choice-of-anchor J domain-containing protein [Ignavibacteria bacterium]